MTLIEFAGIMESKLHENSYKGEWSRETNGYLLRRIEGELQELRKLLQQKDANPADVAREAADVANFCYMIADNAERD